MQGVLGRAPDPRTLWKPCGRLLFNSLTTYILGDINNDSLGSGGGFASFLRHEGPDLVEVDGGFEILISLEVEMTLAGFTEVTGVAIAGQKKGVLTISRS